PMLPVVPSEDDAPFIPLTGRLQWLVRRRAHKIVQARRLAIPIHPRIRIGVTVIVQNLVFEAQRRARGWMSHRQLFADVVLDPAVPALGDLPLERQFEIAEGLRRHQISTGAGLPVRLYRYIAAWDLHDGAVLDRPVGGRNLIPAAAAPAVEGCPIEEEAPTFTTLLLRQRIQRTRSSRSTHSHAWFGFGPRQRIRLRGTAGNGKHGQNRCRRHGEAPRKEWVGSVGN